MPLSICRVPAQGQCSARLLTVPKEFSFTDDLFCSTTVDIIFFVKRYIHKQTGMLLPVGQTPMFRAAAHKSHDCPTRARARYLRAAARQSSSLQVHKMRPLRTGPNIATQGPARETRRRWQSAIFRLLKYFAQERQAVRIHLSSAK